MSLLKREITFTGWHSCIGEDRFQFKEAERIRNQSRQHRFGVQQRAIAAEKN
jgi:hypothetical protein